VIDTAIKSNPTYEWIDVVGIPQRPPHLESNLYLATHSKGEDGWDNGFDRRPSASKVAYDKGWHLGVEMGVETGGAEYLMVKDLELLAKKLYENCRSESNPYIIGVTGSVGKTTTVAFLEHLLENTGSEVSRFYSKRLTQ
jgi:UDP-N-acetylmuramyl pentapeptide synthase